MACSPLDSANTIVPPVAAEVIAAKTSNRLDDTPTGVAPSYMFLRKWGSKGNGDGQFNFPTGIAVDNSGNLYVADKENHRVQKFSSEGAFLLKWGREGTGKGQFYFPIGVAVDSAGNLYVVDEGNHRIQKFSSEGTFLSTWGGEGRGNGKFFYPLSVAVDHADNV
jgi:DNA-binding beta-propeller fold protein YncE